ncbi:EamA family transporter RarD [Ruegeria pomeroyi]|uniref:RarD n=2 Tax=Ruegeria pomeroyi TaxID=89184 RepID=Q5LN17_RUEPO|nr:EamA family transporter RarD [Ruegeria pomeroyi]HCE71885.1 EamA family transporter RarD [Ruegeria sp.]AAV96622.1 RarD [Ruegeria pomeroyi DSS-3]NVK98664.1 EamA family transporter RarD [Ruegeria pomeroyi]NVL01872.1 EamA family transporter RarD [Ruegeria pomeroyi]QWV10160.1 EamA family transporter RarD [Ruegeria pomeroyi]
MSDQRPENVDTPKGLALAITAYLLWGFLPLYMKLLAHVPSIEVVAHRVIWSVPVAGALLVALGRTRDLRAALRNPRMLGMACLTAALISVNWAIYVWSINNGRALDAALGYYINPLFSIALAGLFLGERLSRAQIGAILLAAAGVAVLIVQAGELPWAALGLTFSWGFYALFKRSLPIGPNQGFLLEVLILTPFALAYVLWLMAQGQGHFGGFGADSLLLAGAGVVTAVPLLFYANGAKLVRLSTMGILQYIAPTMIFISAVALFGEEIDRGRMIAFPMIWAALVIYSVPMLRQMRRTA